MNQTNQAAEVVDRFVAYCNQLDGMPAGALTVLICIALGYILRTIKRFPNGGIPLAVTLSGCILKVMLADTRAPGASLRIWLARNVGVGLFLGFVAWLAHRLVLNGVEDYLAVRFPFLARALRGLDPDSIAAGEVTTPPLSPQLPQQQQQQPPAPGAH